MYENGHINMYLVYLVSSCKKLLYTVLRHLDEVLDDSELCEDRKV